MGLKHPLSGRCSCKRNILQKTGSRPLVLLLLRRKTLPSLFMHIIPKHPRMNSVLSSSNKFDQNKKKISILFSHRQRSFFILSILFQILFSRACLKTAFCKMCITICGKFCPDEGVLASYDNRIRTKYTAKRGVQITGMIFEGTFQCYSSVSFEFSVSSIVSTLFSSVFSPITASNAWNSSFTVILFTR